MAEPAGANAPRHALVSGRLHGLRLNAALAMGLVVLGMLLRHRYTAQSTEPAAEPIEGGVSTTEPPPASPEPTNTPGPPSRRRHLVQSLGRANDLLFNAVLIGTVAFVLFLAYGVVDNRWYHVVAVKGGSMTPTIQAGDLIVITRPPQQIQPGMILTLEVDNSVVTHRVVQVNADGSFITKGDANDVRDDFGGNTVRVVGQYQFRIPLLGGLIPTANPQPLDSSSAWFVMRHDLGVTGTAGTWELTPLSLSQPSSDGPLP
jgi:signal peptidase I